MNEQIESEEELNRRHAEKMAKRKAARAKMLATKTEERGLLIVHTGAGKGKSTAAFGMVLRCVGHGMGVGTGSLVKVAGGRGGGTAPAELGEAAGLVTEMSLVKHPFRAGVKAQPGIQF